MKAIQPKRHSLVKGPNDKKQKINSCSNNKNNDINTKTEMTIYKLETAAEYGNAAASPTILRVLINPGVLRET